jgi:hypothetical protein
MWDGLARLGVGDLPHISMLEPSAGIGHFLGLMPDTLAEKASRHAVELEPLTGIILKNLYPNATVHIGGFEETRYPDNSFDAVISNVPFGDYPVAFPTWWERGLAALNRWPIHNQCIMRSVEQARPGGVVVLFQAYNICPTVSGKRA